ncbi:MAG TPA: FxLYD domain-containing protein [Bryobacteraceae bacterium]
MAANKIASAEKKQAGIPPVVIVIGLVLVLGLAGFVYLDRVSRQASGPPPPPTGAAKAYVRSLKFADVAMQAHESYLKQSIVEITGNITNAGDRILELVEINCVFYDPYGQVVLRERVPIVTRKMGKFAPGDTKPFRLAFDTVPESWNQQMPQMVIARIDFP